MADADHWTVIGVSPEMSHVTRERACRRQEARYRKVLEQASLPSEARDLAERIYARVVQATEAVRARPRLPPQLELLRRDRKASA